MKLTIRTSEGLMVSKFTGQAARRLADQLMMSKPAKLTTFADSKTGFRILDDMKYTMLDIHVYLWMGYRVIID